MTGQEVQVLYKEYQEKKSLIERNNALIEAKQQESQRIEQELSQKYGVDFAQVIQQNVAQLQEWVNVPQIRPETVQLAPQQVLPPVPPIVAPPLTPASKSNPFNV